jgi:hypothetical protein
VADRNLAIRNDYPPFKWRRRMNLYTRQSALLVLINAGFVALAAAQQVTKTISNAHVEGKIAHGGSATGKDGKEHLLVGVRLTVPLEGGIDRVEAVVTHNEPLVKIQESIALYSGKAKNAGSVDLTCPTIRILSANGKISAWAEDCTFNSYNGPIAKE